MNALLLACWIGLSWRLQAEGEPEPKTVEIPRWTVRWLEKPSFSWIDGFVGSRAMFYKGGACTESARCADGRAGVLGSDGKVVMKPGYDRVQLNDRGFVMWLDKKAGFTTWDGKILVPMKYNTLTLLDNGFFTASLPDVTGELVLAPDGRELLRGVEETQTTGDAMIWVMRRDRWAAYGSDGKSLLPHRFAEVSWYSDKAAGVRVGKRWALVDVTGRQITPLKYSGFDYASRGLMVFNLGGDCSNGMTECQKGKFGVINEAGKILLPADYDCVELFEFGEDDVELRAIDHPPGTPSDESNRCLGGRWRHFRKDGTPVFPDTYAYVDPLLDRRHARAVKKGACDTSGNCDDGRWGVLDRAGKVVAPFAWDWIAEPGEKATAVVRDRKWGLLDVGFKEIVAPAYEMIHVDKDAVRFLSGGRWGVMDFAGKVLLPPKYDVILPYAGGSARFLEAGKWGLLGPDGKVRVPAIHPAIGLLKMGAHVFATAGKCKVRVGVEAADPLVSIAGVGLRLTGVRGHDLECDNGVFGLMDAAGKTLLPAKYQFIQTQYALRFSPKPATGGEAAALPVPPGKVWVRLNLGARCLRATQCEGGKWGLADLTGRVIIAPEHAYLEPSVDHVARVAKGGTCEFSPWRVNRCTPETKWGLLRLEPVK